MMALLLGGPLHGRLLLATVPHIDHTPRGAYSLRDPSQAYEFYPAIRYTRREYAAEGLTFAFYLAPGRTEITEADLALAIDKHLEPV